MVRRLAHFGPGFFCFFLVVVAWTAGGLQGAIGGTAKKKKSPPGVNYSWIYFMVDGNEVNRGL